MTFFPRVHVVTAAGDGQGTVAELIARAGCTLEPVADRADVLVLDARAPLDPALARSLADGGLSTAGLVVLAHRSAPVDPAVGLLLDRAGLGCAAADGTVPPAAPVRPAVQPRPVGRAAGLRPGTTVTGAFGVDLLARVDPATISPLRALTVAAPATALLSDAHGAVVAACSTGSARRIVLLGTDLAGAEQLVANAVTFAARPRAARTDEISSRTTNSDSDLITGHPAWHRLKAAVCAIRELQIADGSIPVGEQPESSTPVELVRTACAAIEELAPFFPHDDDYLAATVKDLTRWADSGFGVPDFLDSLTAFHPERDRVDGRRHLVVFAMYTQNGNPDRNLEAVLVQVIWPGFVAELEAGDYSNPMFVPIRFLDFTPGYDTNSAVLFPETIAMREVPTFTWGAIFADREAARFRAVVTAAAEITRLALPPDAARLLDDQQLAEQTFVMWDLIHDRTHMHGDLPFDPFMIKQRMPYFLYSLEELRCDLTAFRESVRLESEGVPHARLVQYAILFDRIFRFAITGTRVRNYDGLGGQLLFAWLHQHRVLHWTDNALTIDWSAVTEPVLELGREIEQLYWQSIDRPKTAHWLAAHQLVARTLTPHPASVWAGGAATLPVDGPPKGLTDAVLPDEFPLSMFYEALQRKLSPVVAGTAGITGSGRPATS